MGEATDRPDSPNVLAKWTRASRENCSRDLKPVSGCPWRSLTGWLIPWAGWASDAVLPLPAICLAALRLHHHAQAAVKDTAGPFWIPTGHLFTTPRRSAP
jgi:hypothetical protein